MRLSPLELACSSAFYDNTENVYCKSETYCTQKLHRTQWRAIQVNALAPVSLRHFYTEHTYQLSRLPDYFFQGAIVKPNLPKGCYL